MIEEKHLLKLMDRALKSGGYQLVCGDRGIELQKEEEWRFGIDYDKVTSRIKGKLVEHMDFLPEDGAWMVYADGAQQMEMTTALMHCGVLVPQRQLRMLRTSVTVGGMVIYQNEDNLVCAALPTSWLLCAGEENVLVDTEHGICYKSEEGCSAAGRCLTKRTDYGTEASHRIARILEALERVRMVGAESVDAEPEQEDLLAEDGNGEDRADG